MVCVNWRGTIDLQAVRMYHITGLSIMPKLFLFDVDLTLIDTDRAGSRALASAFEELYGVAQAFTGIPFAGRTDSSIVADAFSRHGIDHNTDAHTMKHFMEAYFEHLTNTLVNSPNGRVLPGVNKLLQALNNQPGVSLGLTTGNFRRSALMKLEHYGLSDFFVEGGFGDDSPDRNELVAIAIDRMNKKLGHDHSPNDIIVVGDTPHDITSGKANNTTTVAVATGYSTMEELAAYHPTHLFADLTDVERVIKKTLT
jgi:phosphoglycolate phosphatase-like HAD superfamily hydrolase